MSGSMRQRIDIMSGWGEEGVDHAIAELGGFRVRLQPPQALAIPPGYIVATIAEAGSQGVRWGYLDEDSKAHVKAAAVTLHDFLDSYSSSRSRAMVEWERFLSACMVT